MDTIDKLVYLYDYLVTYIQADDSYTVQLIKENDQQKIKDKLLVKLKEAFNAVDGVHVHKIEKVVLARQVLQAANCDLEFCHILMELMQISYWCIVLHHMKRKKIKAAQIKKALTKGAGTKKDNAYFLNKLQKSIQTDTVYQYIGQVLNSLDLPLDIFARLDLKEMMQKPYLKDVISEL